MTKEEPRGIVTAAAQAQQFLSQTLRQTLYAATPKAVFAAIAVSYATCGGDYIERAHENVLREWWVLHENGIVPQRPPYPKPPSPA